VDAIAFCTERLSLYAPSHPARGVVLDQLGIVLQIRFQLLGEPKDINDAIEFQREALTLSTDRAQTLANLGDALQTRFERLGDSKDEEEAVQLREEEKTLSDSS
jgi:hypothetical protein